MSYMERELYHILGIYLKEAREKSGLTLSDVSEIIGTTPMTVQRYEKGDRKISIEKVRELCRCYGVNADNLMQDAASEFKSIYTRDASEDSTIAAHHDSEDWTPEELDEIEKFKDFVRSKRLSKQGVTSIGGDPLEGKVRNNYQKNKLFSPR